MNPLLIVPIIVNRITKSIATFFILLICSWQTLAQQQATVLVLTNKKAKVFLDGEEKGLSEPNIPFKVTTTEGEHYAQVQWNNNGVMADKAEIVNLEPGKQKILKLLFDDQPIVEETKADVQVADVNFYLPGASTVFAWQSDNEGKTYPYPEFYYAFETGDEIVVNVSMSNKKGTNVINISTYPDGVIRYTNNAFTELKDLKIKVPKRCIYKFVFATNHAFDRNSFFKISRKAASEATTGFNSKVSLQKIYTPVSLHEPQDFFINGGMNATVSTGKSRVTIPVNLPENTVEWYYRFSASRNKEDIENVKQNFKLFAELTTLIFGLTGTGGTITDMAFSTLAQPPGADYCDIYLLPVEHRSTFEAKADDQLRHYPEGGRKNFKSGNVRVTGLNTGHYYLGIKNPANMLGINVSIEVVAITAKDDYVMEQ